MARFEAELFRPNPKMDFLFVMLSDAASAPLPRKGMTMLRGTVDGHAFEQKVQPMKEGGHRLFISKAVREATGLAEGDRATFELEPAD